MMSDYEAAIASYTTYLDLTWLGESYPHEVQRALLVSAERDLQVGDIPLLLFSEIQWNSQSCAVYHDRGIE